MRWMPALLMRMSTGRSRSALANAATPSSRPTSTPVHHLDAESVELRRRCPAGGDDLVAALDAFLRQREADAAVGAGDDDPGHQFRSSGKVGSGWNSMPSSTSFLASSVRRLAVDAARLGLLVVDLARLLGEAVADIVGVLGHLLAELAHRLR